MLNFIRRGGFIKLGRGLVSIVKHGFGLHHRMHQLKIRGGGVAQMKNPDHLEGGKVKSKRIKPLKFLV